MNIVCSFAVRVGFIAVLAAALARPDTTRALPPPAYPNNGVWLSHDYVKYTSYTSLVSTLCTKMNTDYSVQYLFVNVGTVGSNGQMMNPGTEMAQIVTFLNDIKTWETANSPNKFKVFAYINGTLDSTQPNYLDVSSAANQANVVTECTKFVSTTVAGSYVSGATRTFDGVQIDFEPAGGSDALFNNLKTMMSSIQSKFSSLGLSSKLTSFTAPQYNLTPSAWSWTPVYYYYMGLRVNVLAAMTYDSGCTTAGAYETWVQGQTVNILQAVSGKYWNNDAQHPQPTNGVKTFVGFPAYPSDPSHDPTVENIVTSSTGTNLGLQNLASTGDTESPNYFLGASVFLHTTGTSSDGYAGWTTDWWDFGHYWLQVW